MKLTSRTKVLLACYFAALIAVYYLVRNADLGQGFPYLLTTLHAFLVLPVSILMILAVYPTALSEGVRQRIFQSTTGASGTSSRAGYVIGSLLLLFSIYFSYLEEANQLAWKEEADRLKSVQDG